MTHLKGILPSPYGQCDDVRDKHDRAVSLRQPTPMNVATMNGGVDRQYVEDADDVDGQGKGEGLRQDARDSQRQGRQRHSRLVSDAVIRWPQLYGSEQLPVAVFRGRFG